MSIASVVGAIRASLPQSLRGAGTYHFGSSNSVSVTTLPTSDTVPPSAPTNLRIEIDQGCAEVWLAWDQSTDDVDVQACIEYEVYVNGVLSPLAVDTGVGRSFVYGTNQGLNSFVVKAVDRSGNTSAPSNTATAELWQVLEHRLHVEDRRAVHRFEVADAHPEAVQGQHLDGVEPDGVGPVG